MDFRIISTFTAICDACGVRRSWKPEEPQNIWAGVMESLVQFNVCRTHGMDFRAMEDVMLIACLCDKCFAPRVQDNAAAQMVKAAIDRRRAELDEKAAAVGTELAASITEYLKTEGFTDVIEVRLREASTFKPLGKKHRRSAIRRWVHEIIALACPRKNDRYVFPGVDDLYAAAAELENDIKALGEVWTATTLESTAEAYLRRSQRYLIERKLSFDVPVGEAVFPEVDGVINERLWHRVAVEKAWPEFVLDRPVTPVLNALKSDLWARFSAVTPAVTKVNSHKKVKDSDTALSG